jgi:hypothetical protein
MLKRFGLTTLALATALAVAAPTVTLAAERNDRGRGFDHHEAYRAPERVYLGAGRDRGRFGIGVGVYAAPVPVPAPVNGYYDQFGVWHAYAVNGYYDQFGVWHAYGY